MVFDNWQTLTHKCNYERRRLCWYNNWRKMYLTFYLISVKKRFQNDIRMLIQSGLDDKYDS